MTNNWIYENTADNSSRFLLGETGQRTLICSGINPSTAEPENLDNTLTAVRRFARDHGYDSWLMINVYPQRATNPNDLHAEMDNELHRLNLQAIESVFAAGKTDIWAAWGTLIHKRKYLAGCLNDIYQISQKYSVNWLSIGKITKAGHPHHPLYLKKESPIERFDMQNYITTLKQ